MSIPNRYLFGFEIEKIFKQRIAVLVGDVVLVRWKGNYLLHLVKAIQEGQVLIGNNLGKENEWVFYNEIVARVVESGPQTNSVVPLSKSIL